MVAPLASTSVSTTIVIVQHGDKVREPGDPGLTELGGRQADTTAHAIEAAFDPVSAVVSSPLRRAQQTAAPIAARLGLGVRTDDRLVERMNWTADSGLDFDAFLDEWNRASADRNHRPPVGDSSAATGDRMRALFDELADAHPGETVVVTTHGGATVDLLRTLIGDDGLVARAPGLIEEGPTACGLTVLNRDADGWQVITIADTAHLDAGRPTWWIDEDEFAGAEHLDVAYVAGYEAKAGFDPSEDIEILVGHGLGAASSLVDLGAGTGVFTLAAAAHAGRVIAVDVSAAMVDVMRGKAASAGADNVEVVLGGFLSYDHAGAAVDFAYSRNALHQLPDFWKAIALQRIHGLLRPGGIFRLRDLVFDFEPGEAEERIAAWVAGAVDDAAKGFTGPELEAHVRDEFSTWSWVLEPMLERVGFEILDATHVRGAYGAYTCRRV